MNNPPLADEERPMKHPQKQAKRFGYILTP